MRSLVIGEWTFELNSVDPELLKQCWNKYFPSFVFRFAETLTGKGKLTYCWAEGGVYSLWSAEFNTREEMYLQVIEDCKEFLKRLTKG